MEILKDIKGYEGLYKASSSGYIKSLPRNTTKGGILKQHKNTYRGGYLSVALTKNGVQKTYKVHRLIGQTFIDNYKNKPEINHKNGIKTDNRVENLEWCTRKENEKHKYINHLQGEYIKAGGIGIYARKAIGEKHHLSHGVSLYNGDKLIGKYGSITQASIKTGFNYDTIIRYLKGLKSKRKSKYDKYNWVYN